MNDLKVIRLEVRRPSAIQDWIDQSLQKKIYAFDLDGTLVKGNLKPTELIGLFLKLLLYVKANNGLVAIISGSPIEGVEKKLLNDVATAIKKMRNLELFKYIKVSASGGLLPFSYTESGQRTYHQKAVSFTGFSQKFINEILQTVNSIIREKQFWGNTPDEVASNLHLLHAWASSKSLLSDVANHPPSLSSISAQLVKVSQTQRDSIINIELRYDPSLSKVIQLCIQFLPKVLANQPTGFQGKLAQQLLPSVGHLLQIIPAGYASVDLNPAGVGGKSSALKSIIAQTPYTPKDVLFVGDELIPAMNGNFPGNDWEIFDVAGITGLYVGSESIPQTHYPQGSQFLDLPQLINVSGPSAVISFLNLMFEDK